MGSIKKYISEHAVLEMIVQIILAIVLNELLLRVMGMCLNLHIFHSLTYFQDAFLGEILAYAIIIGISFLLGYRKLYQKSNVNFRTRWLIGLPFILIIVISMNTQWIVSYISEGNPKHPPLEIMFGILLYLLVGLYEEYLCRGLILNICLSHLPRKSWAMWFAVVISSLTFGIMHIGNLRTGATLEGVLIQVVYAFELGVFLAAVYIRSNSLLFVSMLHALWDLSVSIHEVFYKYIDMAETLSDNRWSQVVFELPFLVWGIFLLRKGVASRDGIECNKIPHKIIFWLTFIFAVILFVFSISFTVYVDSLSVSEYIEFKKNFHVTY